MNYNDSEIYEVVGYQGNISGAIWTVQGGTITSGGSGSAIRVKWDQAVNSGTVRFNYPAAGSFSLSIVIGNLPLVDPPAPVINSAVCGAVTLARGGSVPNGTTWYWQGTNPNGQRTDLGSGANFTVTSSGTYYIRARKSTGAWSTGSGSVAVTVTSNPQSPTMPQIINNCGHTVLVRSNPPQGVAWYWQSSPTGTSMSPENAKDTVRLSAGTVYYLRARNESMACWSSARVINYTVNGGGKTWYADKDGDGFGDPNDTIVACTEQEGYVANGDDLCPEEKGTYYGCAKPPYTPVQFSNDNYVYTRTYTRAMSDPSSVTLVEDVRESIVYYDGLGRPKQEIGIRQTPGVKDIVTHIDYDAFGRQDKEYLPFVPASSSDSYGSFRSGDVAGSTQAYYQARYPADFTGLTVSQVNAYARKQLEASPLNRVEKQAAPGKDWRQGSGHEVEFDYDTNTGQEVRLYQVNITVNESPAGVFTYIPALVLSSANNGYYGAGQLYKTITRDENHSGTTKDHTTEEFKDKQGRVVLKRSYNSGAQHDTYYVYDDYGNLTYVIPPKVNISDGISGTERNELCYQYRYDGRNRLVEKKLPGKAWEYIVYNTLDQPVMTQDSLLKAQKRWLFTKYDAFGRVAYTGFHGSESSRTVLQNTANNTATYKPFVAKTTTPNTYAGTAVYYNNDAIPHGMAEILTINYYDDYTFDLAGLTKPTNVLGQAVDKRTKTMATGSKVRVLGTDHWITTLNAYDSKGRLIYTASRNPYLNTTDVVESLLDFTGKVLKTRTTHTKGSNAPIVTTDIFEYDHAGRLLRQLQCLGGDCGTEEASAANIELNEQLTGHQSKIASSSVILKPGFHFKATSSASFSASISIPGELIAENVYDELGQLTEKKVGNTPQNPLQRIAYTYNVRGWLTDINDVDHPSGKLFNFQINYNKSRSGTVTPLFNGNIAETYWKTGSDNTMRRYAYSYDALNRITSGKFNGGGQTDRYTVEGITYDKNGNIEHLTRRGHLNSGATSFGVMDNLAYTYDTGNKLLKVTDSGNKTYGFKDGTNTNNDYTYDANGNLLTDANKGITGISYNHLNLPTQVSFGSNKIAYIYDAFGTKLKKEVTQGSSVTGTEYANGYIYENGQLQFFSHPEGYVTKESGTYTYIYQYKDHLGNVRVTYADLNNNGVIDPATETLSENNYYPGGLLHRGYKSMVSPSTNFIAEKFKYQGEEYNESLGLNLYEFDLRHYCPTLIRFHTPDPYEQFMSPYVAMGNNPVVAFDPDGGNCYDANGNVISCPDGDIYDDYRGSDTQHVTVLDEVTVSPSGGSTPNTFQDAQIGKIFGSRGEKIAPAITELSGWEHTFAEIAENLQGYRVVVAYGANYHVNDQGVIIGGGYKGGLGAIGLIGGSYDPKNLIRVAKILNKGGLTKIGRALQKHGSRVGSKFPQATGNPATINAQGEKILNEILNNPGSTATTRHHARFGDIVEIVAPNGQGARFSKDGKTFIGLIEK
ncbi:DUF6443 domain-containing protein [Sinomicrobium oceani]|uniref:DUF6443 domain-containing protein n=1 Tax=Sinomicrobium oceani TaxID=1150368 RepID=UPI0015879C8F|nr:DUF6443 domain-containing protein [Sinomicrobium oceani]